MPEAWFTWGARTYIMGIVNATPDSFSGDGRLESESAIAHALAQLTRGSDILDIGGESTRPGHVVVDEETEIARTIPVIRALRTSADPQVRSAHISIDTYKPVVARAACEAGATIINSVWGMPEALLDVALASDASVVITHNKLEAHYLSVVGEVVEFLDEAAHRCVTRGIPPDRILLDPGIGFGKTAEHNLSLLQELDRIVALGFPTLLGTSRKSTIGRLTGRPADERLFGTAATTALAIAAGIDVVRVHDVEETRDVVAVADAIVRNWRPAEWSA